MKTFFYIAIIIALISCSPPNKETSSTVETKVSKVTTETNHQTENSFDSSLAKEYGADQYGMKPYVLAFLKTGPNRPTDSIKAVELQNAHMANINRLAEEGKLVLAGPFYGDYQEDFRGIYIFNTSSIDSAKLYTESDPAIQYGSLKMELINWYGSAALMGLNEAHMRVAKVNI